MYRSLLGNERFPALTGLRAIAAFMVFFHHLHLHTRNNWLTGLQDTFYFGVTIFFALSGFLIAWHYYNKVSFKGRWLLEYFTNRFARIYPVYFLVLTIVILMMHNYDRIFLVQNYTLTHNLFFLFKSHGMAIKPSWTLTVEECFYLLAPVIFWLTRKSNIYVPFFLTFLILVFLLFTYGDGSIQNTVFPIVWLTFFGNVLAFYAGIFLALKMRKEEQFSFKERNGSKYTVIGIVGIMIVDIVLDRAHHLAIPQTFLLRILANNILLPFPVAILLYGLLTENNLVKRVMAGNIFRLFGRSSFVFYLIHIPVIDYIGKPYIYPHFIHAGYDIYVLLTFLITLILSIFLFKFYEYPMHNWIRNIFGATRKNNHIMREGDQFVSIVKTYFEYLISEFRFKLIEQKIKGNVFYDVQYKDKTKVISISYDRVEDYLLVIVFLLQDGKLPHYDDKTKTLHLNVLNKLVLSKLNKDEIIFNNEYFVNFRTNDELERKLLKHAKELRLCLRHFDETGY